MAHVCKWIGYYLCYRDSPKPDQIHPNATMFDAVIVWKEGPKEKAGGMAYEVVLKPASTDSPRPGSPPKNRERPLSQEVIDKKLKEAEERRLSLEAERLEKLAKTKERIEIARQKIQEQNESFSKETEKKLEGRLGNMEEKREGQIKALQGRLRDHAQRVQDVRTASENYRLLLRERIEKKMTAMQGNRESQFKAILERLEEHEKHIQEVLDTSASFSKRTEQKMINKMESTLKNRENQLQQLMERLQEHEQHIQEVRQNKLNRSVNDAPSS